MKIVGIYKKYCLKFQSIQSSFFKFFLFNKYEMADSMDINKYLNINIGTAMKVNRNVKICS